MSFSLWLDPGTTHNVFMPVVGAPDGRGQSKVRRRFDQLTGRCADSTGDKRRR